MNYNKLLAFANRLLHRSVSYDHQTAETTVTWRKHKKVYDFEGYLTSDTFQDYDKTTIKHTYFPGTKAHSFRPRIFSKQIYKGETLTDEVWYDLNGHIKAYASHLKPEHVYLLRDKTSHYLPKRSGLFSSTNPPFQIMSKHEFNQEIISLMDAINKRDYIINYDLNEMSERINDRLSNLVEKAKKHQYKFIVKPSETKTPAPQIEQKILQENIKPVPQNIPPKNVKPKLTLEQRKNRWEEQLLKRMEKHDTLIALKEKVLTSKRMNPDKKAERLASLDRRLTQNERAQHILNTRLKALEMTKDRDTLKQFKTEERSEYKQWQAEAKQAQNEIKAGTLQGQALINKKAELKTIRSFKKQALTDYRLAAMSTKKTSTSLRKLKSTKRQNAIFDLNIIVREKMAIERALKIENDIFKYASLQDRLEKLTIQKRALIQEYKATMPQKKPKRLIDMKRPVQPLLPGFQKNLNNKESA